MRAAGSGMRTQGGGGGRLPQPPGVLSLLRGCITIFCAMAALVPAAASLVVKRDCILPNQLYSGSVMADEGHLYTICPTRAMWEAGVNIRITLYVKTGDSDLLVNPSDAFPAQAESEAVWKSHHGVGDDTVYISHLHPRYAIGRYQVTILGYSPLSLYELTYSYVDDPPYHAEAEVGAFRAVYDKCCGGNETCPLWWDHGGREADACHMVGNICDEEGRLIKLILADQGFACKVPQELGAFPELRVLEIQGNLEAMGDWQDVAAVTDRLPHLERLLLHSCNITGELTCMDANRNLSALGVANMGLSGAIPECLVRKPSLREFYASMNKFTGLPATWRPAGGGLGLDIFTLSGNVGLEGQAMVDDMLKLPRLYFIDIQAVGLVGTLPGEASPVLRQMYIDGNNLTGTLPAVYASLQELDTFSASRNKFSGPLPTSWTTHRLQRLSFASNNFSGTLPIALASLRELWLLSIADNEFDGPLPAITPGFMYPALRIFNGARNRFSGVIQEYLKDIPCFSKVPLEVRPGANRLQVFDVSDNELTGSVPEFLTADLLRLNFVRVRIGGNALICPGEDARLAMLIEKTGVTCAGIIEEGRPAIDPEISGGGPDIWTDARLPPSSGSGGGGFGTSNVVIVVFVCCGVLMACFGTYVIFIRYGPFSHHRNVAFRDNMVARNNPAEMAAVLELSMMELESDSDVDMRRAGR